MCAKLSRPVNYEIDLAVYAQNGFSTEGEQSVIIICIVY